MKGIGLLVLLTLILTGCGTTGQKGYRQVDMNEAIRLMKTETDYLILDVRTPEEFAAGHIPGAINLPNETIDGSALPRKDQLLLIYCRSGNRSKQSAGKLAVLGYTNLVEFGGIRDWPGEIVTE